MTAAECAQSVAMHEALTGSKVWVWRMGPMRFLQTLTPDRDWVCFAVVIPRSM